MAKRPLSPNDALLRMAIGSDTHFNAAGTNTVTAVTTLPAQVYQMEISNPNNAEAFIQFFDLAVGDVTLGTTTPKQSYKVPPNGGQDKSHNVPVNFDVAVSYAITTTLTGSTAPAANLGVNIIFKDTP